MVTKKLNIVSLFYFDTKNLVVQHNLEVTIASLSILGHYFHMK